MYRPDLCVGNRPFLVSAQPFFVRVQSPSCVLTTSLKITAQPLFVCVQSLFLLATCTLFGVYTYSHFWNVQTHTTRTTACLPSLEAASAMDVGTRNHVREPFKHVKNDQYYTLTCIRVRNVVGSVEHFAINIGGILNARWRTQQPFLEISNRVLLLKRRTLHHLSLKTRTLHHVVLKNTRQSKSLLPLRSNSPRQL